MRLSLKSQYILAIRFLQLELCCVKEEIANDAYGHYFVHCPKLMKVWLVWIIILFKNVHTNSNLNN